MSVHDDARERAWAGWRDALAGLERNDVFLRLDPATPGVLDLTHAHPGGIAQFVAGRITKLSNLVREELAYARAQADARHIDHLAAQLAEGWGIDSIALAQGALEWRRDGVDFRAPVFLQDLLLRANGADYDLQLARGLRLNPLLVDALRRDFGIELSERELVTAAHVGTSLDHAFQLLQTRLAGHGGFELRRWTLAANFVDAPFQLRRAARPMASPFLDAVAGVPGAAEHLERGFMAVHPITPDRRSPEGDSLLLDASLEQERVVAQIANGSSFAIQTVPGAGVTQTVVNALGTLLAQRKRVAVLAANRATLRKVATALAELGLAGTAVTPVSLRRDVITAISRNEKHPVSVSPKEQNELFTRLRTALDRYRKALCVEDTRFHVTVEQTINRLADFAMHRQAPTTTVKFDGDTLDRLSGKLVEVGDDLARLAELGEFEFGPDNSAWYGARFNNAAHATSMLLTAKRLASTDLPKMLEGSSELFREAGLRQPHTIQQIGEYLELILGVRDTLERFQPNVYDRSLEYVIIATSTRKDTPEMTAGNRRRLRQLAKEYVRPGAHVADLHASMVEIQRQREEWQKHAINHAPPSVPAGITDVRAQYRAVLADLQDLGAAVRSTPGVDQALTEMPIDQLAATLRRLADDDASLQHLKERTELGHRLKRLGLTDLLRDFAMRHMAADRVREELEFAWWMSVLRYQLGHEQSLLGAKTETIAKLEQDFAKIDRAHVRGNARLQAGELARLWRESIAQHAEQAQHLRALLKTNRLTPETFLHEAPDLINVVAPIWLLSPFTYAQQVPAELSFDTVIVLDGAGLLTAEAAVPIAHARQVVVFGDPVLDAPMPLPGSESAEGPEATAAGGDAAAGDAGDAAEDGPDFAASLFADAQRVLTVLRLRTSYRPGGRALAQIINDRFYDGEIVALPAADEFLDRPSVEVIYVENGKGMPAQETGVVEGVPGEVQKAVELVFSNAVWHPRQSLMVVTASEVNARRIRAAVREELQQREHLREFFSTERAEPFVVLTVDQAAGRSRDRVIFSLGFGRTPHGRVLSHFGSISEPGGEKKLAVALSRARVHLSIVSCIRPGEMRPERLTEGGPMLLEVLSQPAPRVQSSRGEHPQPLLVDLARRLKKYGVVCELEYAEQIALAAKFGNTAIAVETDTDFTRASLRQAVRQRPSQLEALGWMYLRVYAFELFQHPQQVADRIADALGARPKVEVHHVAPGRDSGPTLETLAKEDQPERWGDRGDSNDARLRNEKPPHWQ